jgi:WS/DGAT/MGAT family acyltransferase
VKKGKHNEILGPVDTAFWYVDRPETPMNIGALTILEGQLDFEALTKMIDRRIHQTPIYQQRVVQAPLYLGQPMWMYDPDFFIGNHVFHVELEAPGTEDQLRELVGHLVSGMLDRSKPLWEIYMISGLEGDRTGLFFKVHHCMVDGLSAVELFTTLMDLTPEVPPLPRKPVFDPPYLPPTGQLLIDSIRRDVPHKLNVLGQIGQSVFQLGAVMADKEKRRKALIGMSYLLNDNIGLIKKLPINGTNSGKMMLSWVEFSLAEVRAIRSNRGASVNDVMLTVLGRALERYTRQIDDRNDQKFVRMLIPVNMRVENDRSPFGNRISVLPIDIPFGVDDPLEHLRQVTEYTNVMKQSSLSIGLDVVLSVPSLMPSFAQPLVWAIAPTAFSVLAHTWCTNVAGPQIPVYILGHKMLHSYGFFPLNPSMGLACVVTSYNQRISMTLVTDSAIIPEPTDITQYMANAFTALRRAAKVPEMEPIVIERSKADEPAKPAAAPAVPEVTALPALETPSNGSKPEEAAHAVETIKVPVIPLPDAADEQATLVTAEAAPALTPDAVEELAKVSEPVPDSGSELVEVSESISIAERIVEPEPLPRPVVEAAVVAAAPAVSQSVKTAAPTGRPKLFSEEWAQAYRDAINASENYRKASTRWEAGALAFIMKAAPKNGFVRDTAVLLDLHKGVCRAARSVPPELATVEAAFVIEGEYQSWMEVLSGRSQPLMMIMRGKLRLKKGSIAKLMPFTQSAQELIQCAQGIA